MPRVTVTLDLPEEFAEKFLSLPEAERNSYATAALLHVGKADFAVAGEDNEEELPPLSQEDLESIGRGLADADAGKVISSEAFFAHLDARAARRRNGSATPDASQ